MTKKDGGAAAAGANPYLEAYLGDSHPLPNGATDVTESGAGTYAMGPVRFDAAGRWTVRLHFYAECDDGEESPHSHAGFLLDVP